MRERYQYHSHFFSENSCGRNAVEFSEQAVIVAGEGSCSQGRVGERQSWQKAVLGERRSQQRAIAAIMAKGGHSKRWSRQSHLAVAKEVLAKVVEVSKNASTVVGKVVSAKVVASKGSNCKRQSQRNVL